MSICRKKGHGDHAVIGIFAVISVAGAAAAIAFFDIFGKVFSYRDFVGRLFVWL